MNIDAVISKRIRELRDLRKLTLEELSKISGVSRSMISLIERQETSPTAAVLNKLADALGVSLPSLFTSDTSNKSKSPVSCLDTQALWTDPASGYIRRHLSPDGSESPIELVEVRFPAGETVAFDNPVRSVQTHQQLWLIEGQMVITLEAQTWHLRQGDCLAMVLGERIVFHNPTLQQSRYLLALSSSVLYSRKVL